FAPNRFGALVDFDSNVLPSQRARRVPGLAAFRSYDHQITRSFVALCLFLDNSQNWVESGSILPGFRPSDRPQVLAFQMIRSPDGPIVQTPSLPPGLSPNFTQAHPIPPKHRLSVTTTVHPLDALNPGSPERADFARSGVECHPSFRQRVVTPTHPHPPSALLLKTKAELHFDRTVTDRSKPCFGSVSGLI